jgi:glucose dehydrogenase
LYAYTATQKVIALDAASGKLIWKFDPGIVGKNPVRGATVYDKKFRAFDSLSGQLLWETVLPFSAIATPATYMVDGKQYVVVSSGGGKDPKSSSGSVYVAFSLP